MYYQSSARPNDPSEPDSERLKTLLDNLNNLRGKLKNFTVIDELGQPIGEINDLILDAGHQLNLVIAQPDAQARQASVLLNGRRIKKVSVQTQSVFVDITKADVRFLPEYLLPDESPAPTTVDFVAASSPPVAQGGLDLTSSIAAEDTPDFSLDVMEAPALESDFTTASDFTTSEVTADDLDFLGLDATSTADEPQAFADLELPNEARSLDEFSLLESAAVDSTPDLPDFDLGDETAITADLPDLSLNQDATEEWDEFDRIMATDPTEAAGTLDLSSNLEALEDSNPVPESFALVESESDPLAGGFRLDSSEDIIEAASRRAATESTAESGGTDDWGAMGFEFGESAPALEFGSEADLPELNLTATDTTSDLPELSFDDAESAPAIAFSTDQTDDLAGLSFDEPVPSSGLDLDLTDDLSGLNFDTAAEADDLAGFSFDAASDQTDELAGFSFDEPTAEPALEFGSPDADLADLNFDEVAAEPALEFGSPDADLADLNFDEVATEPALELAAAETTEAANLESEWADFDREMDLPAIDLASLDSSSTPAIENSTELDFTDLELPEEAAMDLYLETAPTEATAELGELAVPTPEPDLSLDFTDSNLDFNDALNFVESEETASDFNVTELGEDGDAIAFTTDATAVEPDLETISSLADLDFTAEPTPLTDDFAAPEASLGLLSEPDLSFDLAQPEAESPLDLTFDQPDSLNLEASDLNLDFSLDQPESIAEETALDLSFDQPEADSALDLSFDQPEPEPSLDLSFDQPETESPLDLSFDQPEPEAALDLGFEQPESGAFDLDFDQPLPDAALDITADQPIDAASFDLGLEDGEPGFDLGVEESQPDLSFDAPGDAIDLGLSFDQPGSEIPLEFGGDQPDASDSLDFGWEDPASMAMDVSSPSDLAATFEAGLEPAEPFDLTSDLPAPPDLNLDDLALSSTPIDLPETMPALAMESAMPADALANEFGLASIPAETFELTNSESLADPELGAAATLSDSEEPLPIESVDAIVPLLEERLKVAYDRRKVGEVIVRKRIETRMVQVPVRYEKLVIEQVGADPKTLAEVDLSQGALDNVDLSGLAGKPVVTGEFKSPKTASYVLDAIAKTLQQRCKSVRIEVELDDPKLQKAYQDWLDQCSQM